MSGPLPPRTGASQQNDQVNDQFASLFPNELFGIDPSVRLADFSSEELRNQILHHHNQLLSTKREQQGDSFWLQPSLPPNASFSSFGQALAPTLPTNVKLLSANTTQQVVEEISKQTLSSKFVGLKPQTNNHGAGGAGVKERIQSDPKFVSLAGKVFLTGKEAAAATRTHAGEVLNHNLVYDMRLSGGRSLHLKCKSGCPLAYRWTKPLNMAGWQMDFEKTCMLANATCPSSYKMNKNDLLGNDSFSALSNMKTGNKKVGPKAVHEALHSVGFSASIFSVKHALKEAQLLGKEHYNAVYQLVKPYLESVRNFNEKSQILIETNPDGTFNAACLVVGQMATLVSSIGLEVIGLDGQHHQNKKHNLNWMSVVGVVPLGLGKDVDERKGRNMNALVAKIVYKTEKAEAYSKLIALVRKHDGMESFLKKENLVVFSDRGLAVMKSIREDLPNAIALNCARHILLNAQEKSKEEIDPALFWSLRNAKADDDFMFCCKKMRENHPSAMDYFERETDMSTWVFLKIMLKHPQCSMYGMQTSNLVEQEHARTTNTGAISTNPLEMFQQMVVSADQSLRIIRSRVTQWVEDDKSLVPVAEASYMRQKELSKSVVVHPSGGKSSTLMNCINVNRTIANCRTIYQVDLGSPFKPHGMCEECNQMKTICRHYFASLNRFTAPAGGQIGAAGFKDEYSLLLFTHHPGYLVPIVNNVMASLPDIALPALDSLEKGTILPPIPFEEAGRTKRKPNARKLSKGEKYSKRANNAKKSKGSGTNESSSTW